MKEDKKGALKKVNKARATITSKKALRMEGKGIVKH